MRWTNWMLLAATGVMPAAVLADESSATPPQASARVSIDGTLKQLDEILLDSTVRFICPSFENNKSGHESCKLLVQNRSFPSNPFIFLLEARDANGPESSGTLPADVAEKVRVPSESFQREKGAYLGVSASAPPAVLRNQLGLPAGMGLVVDFVVPESPAAVAGIKLFDVLQKLDDQLLVNQGQLAVLVRSHKPGDQVTLRFIRQGKPATLAVKLIEHELEPLAEDREHDELNDAMKLMIPEARIHMVRPRERTASREENKIDAASITWLDGDRSYTINTDPAGHRTFIAKDREGKSIFEGLIDTPGQRDRLPKDLKGKADRMLELLPGVEKPSIGDISTQPAPPDKSEGNNANVK